MRKISPHVNIYKFPITAVSSITNRITGFALTGYFIGSGFYCWCPSDKIIDYYNELDWKLRKAVSYSFIFPLTYHTFGGIRHFIWDYNPKLLNNSLNRKSSYILYGSSILSTYIAEKLLIEN